MKIDLYRAAEHGYHYFECMNIREFPLEYCEHHELETNPGRVYISELLEDGSVILEVCCLKGSSFFAFDPCPNFLEKPKIGNQYEIKMIRSPKETTSWLEYKKI